MITVNLELKQSKARKDGTCPVWIRFTEYGKSRFTSSGVAVLPEHWNRRRQEVKKSHPDAKELNAGLRALKSEAEATAGAASSLTEAVQKDIPKAKQPSGSLTRFFEQFIADIDGERAFWNRKKYRVTLGKLRDTFGQHIDFEQIDLEALERFDKRLRTKYGNNGATRQKEMSQLRRVFRQAIKKRAIDPSQNPFVGYDMPKASKPERRRLAMPEIRAIEALDSLEYGSAERVARDAWLTSLYLAGMRFSDVIRLKPSQFKNGHVTYQMQKSRRKMAIMISEPLRDLIQPYLDDADYYVFPLLEEGDETDPAHLRRRISSHNVIVNRALKEVAKKAGVEPEGFTMHTARHSFANQARKSGDLFTVSKALGHSKLSTTQAYLDDFDDPAVDKLISTIWNESEGMSNGQ